jgi:uncharacterized protein YdaU (DUF1376 family)
MNRPWMPLYVGDYLGDTGHLTTAQHGAYLLLMMHYWRKGELPDDDRQLSKITKLPLRTWCEYRPTLQDFFHSGWKHKRIDAELGRMMRVSEKRAIAGQKGGLGSALSRMKLENASRSRQPPQRAIAVVGACCNRRRPLTPRLISESSSRQDALRRCLNAACRGDGKARHRRQSGACGLCRQANDLKAERPNKPTT